MLQAMGHDGTYSVIIQRFEHMRYEQDNWRLIQDNSKILISKTNSKTEDSDWLRSKTIKVAACRSKSQRVA